jgi:apolipoprotein N-acyltransferase
MVPGFGWLVGIALVPVLLVISPNHFWPTWSALAAVYGLYNALTLYWISYWAPGFGWLLLLVAGYLSPWILIPACCCRLFSAVTIRSASTAGWLLLPASWALMEILSRRLVFGAIWTIFGQPLSDYPALMQASALGGPELLSLLALALNVACVLGFKRTLPPSIRILALAQGPGLLIAIGAWGAWQLDRPAGADTKLRVAVIQPMFDGSEWGEPARREAALQRCTRMIDRVAADHPDVIVIPESVIGGFVRYEKDLAEWVRGTVMRTRLPLLFSTFDRPEGTIARVYSSAILITPYGTVTTYAKRHLVPIGEYVPAVWPLNGLIRWLRGNLLEFTGGDEATVFRLAGGQRFGALICYEDIFPDLARDSAQAGAQLLVTLGNLSSFGESCAGREQLRRAQLTAAAVGLPMVRCTNSGISCAIDARGLVRSTLADAHGRVVMVEGAKTFEIPLEQIPTVYRACGDGMGTAVLGLLLTAGLTMPLAWKKVFRNSSSTETGVELKDALGNRNAKRTSVDRGYNAIICGRRVKRLGQA